MKISNQVFLKYSLFFFFLIYGIGRYISSNYFNSVGLLILPLYLSVQIFYFILFYRIKISIRNFLFPFLFILTILIGYYRVYIFDSSLVGIPTIVVTLLLFLLLFLYFTIVYKYFTVEKIFIILMNGYLFYYIVNILLYYGGFKNLALLNSYNRELETILPWLDNRVCLPLSTSYNDTSAQSLMAAIIALSLYENSKKLVYIFILVIAVYGIMLGGSRMILLDFIIMFFIIKLKMYTLKRSMIFLAYILILFPIIYLFFLSTFYKLGVFEYLEIFSRGNVMEIVSLNNRIFIWIPVLVQIFQDSKLENILFGYGFYGQTISGVVEQYVHFFENAYANTSVISTHNSFLQSLINYGVIGSIIFFINIRYVLKYSLKKENYLILNILLSMLFICTLEVSAIIPSFVSMFFYLYFVIIYLDNNKKKV